MLDAGNEGRTQEALRLADKLRKNYSDFYFSYVWLGILYRRLRTPQRRSIA